MIFKKKKMCADVRGRDGRLVHCVEDVRSSRSDYF